RDLEHRLQELRLHLALVVRGHIGQDRLDLLGEIEALRVEDHQFLLDADGEGRPVEAVFEHEWARVLWASWRSRPPLSPSPSRSRCSPPSHQASARGFAACSSSSGPGMARSSSCPSTRASSTAPATSSPTRPPRIPNTNSTSRPTP